MKNEQDNKEEKVKRILERKKRGKKALQATSMVQIFILIIGVVAIGYAFGSEVEVVSGNNNNKKEESGSLGEDLSSIGQIVTGILNLPATGAGGSDKKSPNSNGGGEKVEPGSTASGHLGVDPRKGGGEADLDSMQAGGGWDAIVSGAQWALVAWGVTALATGLLGLDEGLSTALEAAIPAGFGVGRGVHTLIKEGGAWEGLGESIPGSPGIQSTVLGVGVAAAVFYFTYEESEEFYVEYNCKPWDAPTGGEHCEECNKMGGGLTCSEYQCRSLGQACELVNSDTPEAKCVWKNEDDTNPPEIKPFKEALLEEYEYSEPESVSPPDRGTGIKSLETEDGCVPPFTPISFGIETNEPSRCKIDYRRKSYEENNEETFKKMDRDFGESSLFRYNHTQTLSLPGPDSGSEEDNITINNDGVYELYVRCMDYNGNTNPANYVFKYCVQEGPDETPPEMVSTSITNGMPISHNKSSVNLTLYTNEPAECRWDKEDVNYDNMNENNQMSCSNSMTDINSQSLFPCETTLTGLKKERENNFYFRCKDQPDEPEENRNANSESYEFMLEGTKPLILDSASPNNTVIKDSTDSIKITLEAKTSQGYKDGLAKCYYKNNLEDEQSIEFKDTNANTHSQDLYLTEGDYEYEIECIDAGGNSDSKNISFEVESDSSPPKVVRIFREQKDLNILTNEEGECVYTTDSEQGCSYSYDDGDEMETQNEGKSHKTQWESGKEHYIKCQDKYENRPDPESCSVTVKPFENN